MKKKITMRDIAQHANVALSTVSQVFNNKPNVTAEMRQHVLEVATQLGYSKSAHPNQLAKSRLSTVGLLTKSRVGGNSMLMNPFYSHIIVSVESECQRNNINLMYANIAVDERNYALNMPPMLLDEVVDGVIVVGAFLEETITDISRRAGRNIVLLDAYTPDEVVFDSVLIDNYQGACIAVAHLIVNGHRKIGLIGSNEASYPSILERRRGYLATLERYGIHETYIEESTLNPVMAGDATQRLLECHPDITAIFACNDTIASSIVRTLHQMNLRVPDDISVIGFDDIDIAHEMHPPLTTIHVDKPLIGAIALQCLLERVDNPNRPALKTVVSTRLVTRGSVKKLVD